MAFGDISHLAVVKLVDAQASSALQIYKNLVKEKGPKNYTSTIQMKPLVQSMVLQQSEQKINQRRLACSRRALRSRMCRRHRQAKRHAHRSHRRGLRAALQRRNYGTESLKMYSHVSFWPHRSNGTSQNLHSFPSARAPHPPRKTWRAAQSYPCPKT